MPQCWPRLLNEALLVIVLSNGQMVLKKIRQVQI